MKSVFLLAGLAGFLLTSIPVSAQPKIVLEKGGSFSLDTLMAGVVTKKTIKVRNEGTAPLAISKVEASCGCTGTLLSSDTLKPGDSGDLEITFNSKNFSGSVHKTVTIYSNDPATPKAKVDFTAFVKEDIQISETRFLFKDAVVGQRRSMTVTLKNNGKENLELKGYTSTLPGFVLRFPPVVKPGQTVEIIAEYTPKEARKVLSSNVSLQTNSATRPEIPFYVFGSVKEWKFE